MTPCIYVESTGCTSCDQLVYKKCPLFIKAHLSHLMSSIMPFTFIKVDNDESIVFSGDVNTIKSACAQKAFNLNRKVKSITMNNAMALAMGEEDLEDYVYYLDCSAKLVGQTDKIGSVIVAFIDKCQYKNIPVFIYKPPTTVLPITNYTRL